MAKLDVESILVIGSGPIVIGQACEFDYSGTQACRALKEEGYRVILVNSNPATIMTDRIIADATYIEPITPQFVEKIIKKEKPQAILPTVGGQTALNCALELHASGILDKYGIKMIGASPQAIDKAENRQKFNEAMGRIGLEVPRNAVVRSLEAAMEAIGDIGLPAIIRPSFTLGGSGGGIASTEEEFREIVAHGLDMSPTNEVLIDESILGWKEYEMEVIRDKNDNAIIVCSIENIDPMGVHTGDSITVAPALTLTDKEYQIMRNASIAVLREIGVETGGSNVQFAINPQDGRLVVIEMNPRVSRSSALASKVTGFPIARVAALLAIGYTLDEIKNNVTKVTPASFEPTIDYVVIKIPRFTFEKFNDTAPILSSTMRAVGESMAIGRNFAEAMQKALYSMETGLTGFNAPKIEGLNDSPDDIKSLDIDNSVLLNAKSDESDGGSGVKKAKTLKEKRSIIKESLKILSPDRILKAAHALRHKISVEEICEITGYDPWYIREIEKIVNAEEGIRADGLPQSKFAMLGLKKMGFSDERLARLAKCDIEEVRKLRDKLNIYPVFKRVDTCSAEFESFTPYMYSCYEGDSIIEPQCESQPSDKKKVVILGGGPNRIGQGIEFDYACVHAAFTLSDAGYETIMINCNPETVSTDYDTSDRLYFEPMTSEHVIEVIKREQSNGHLVGVIVQFGGQTALKLARHLDKAGISIIGTSFDKIDLAEDRERFQKLLHKIGLIQPVNTICYKLSEMQSAITKIGYPVIVRPSNVLGGRAMEVLYNEKGLQKYFRVHGKHILDGPILIDKFLENAVEADIDALSDGEDVHVAGIMQHIEEAGIHSGDSACSIPPYSLSQKMIDEIRESTRKLAKEIGVIGLMNVQYAIKDEKLYVIEVNPRASRTVPFVAKATGVNIAQIASLLMVGRKLKEFNLDQIDSSENRYYSVKEVVFPFARFANVDTVLGPEMKSTGEVMGSDSDFNLAFAKSQIAAGNNVIIKDGGILISVKDGDKNDTLIDIAAKIQSCGFKIYTTKGTRIFLEDNGIKNVTEVLKEKEDGYTVIDLMNDKKVDLVINTTIGSDAMSKSFNLRRTALMNRIFYITTISATKCLVDALVKLNGKDNDGQKREMDIVCLQNM